MFDYRNSGSERYGQQIYHHYRKQGNHRWDTSVHQIAAANTRLFSGTPSAKTG
jgi:hypothetical protein